MGYKIILILLLILSIVVIALAQFSIPTLFGADGYLHIRMAKFIQQYGLMRNFHWARYSLFAQRFADKDFLYHVLLIPFTFFQDIFFGAKLSAVLFTVFLYLVFCVLLKEYCRERILVLVFLLAFFGSAPFLQAISQTRNLVLITALMLIFVHLIITGRRWSLFFLSAACALSHVISPLLLLFAFFGELCRFIQEKRFLWRTPGFVAAGLTVGFLVHPHFPNNLLVFYLNGILVPIFSLKWGLELGAEFFPISTREFVLDYPFILLGLVAAVALGLSASQKIKLATRVWMAVAGFFFVFSFFSQRYIIHGYPVILIAISSYLSDWWVASERLPWLRYSLKLKVAVSCTFFMLLVMIGLRTYREFRSRAISEKVYNQHYEAVGKWMANNLPAGEVVFHANWSDSQYLIGLNPKDDYFVTLDPIYMYYWDRKKYHLYREVAFGRHADPYAVLKNDFGVRFGYAGKIYFSGLINQIRPDPHFHILAEDALGVIFQLK